MIACLISLPWTDRVHTREVPPLVRQRPSQVDAACFRDVVGCLLLGIVRNMA